MNFKDIILITMILGIGFFILSDSPTQKTMEEIKIEERVVVDANSFTAATWNLQIFGTTKASKPELIDYYADKMDDYDLVFVQEIRDKSGTAFPVLCDELEGFECLVSSRAGRSSSKEQVGVVFNDKVEVLDVNDWALFDGMYEFFERPPVLVRVRVGGEVFLFVSLHAKPGDIVSELEHLEVLLGGYGGRIIVIGDLNADCSYFDRDDESVFVDWFWVVGDDVDTTVASSSCAYDRLVLNGDAFGSFVDFGVMDDVVVRQSDHFLVWGLFNS
jgi:deoxyribonuclease-1-like protein